MIKIQNNTLEFNSELPSWWIQGQDIRIIPKENNSFFVYKYDSKRAEHSTIGDGGVITIDTPDGWYDVLIHSKVCVRLIFNRGLDVSPDKDIPVDNIDPRTASVYDLNYWFFRKAQEALKSGSVPRGFADAVKVMESAFYNMKLERKGLTQRPMETREIIIESDDDED